MKCLSIILTLVLSSLKISYCQINFVYDLNGNLKKEKQETLDSIIYVDFLAPVNQNGTSWNKALQNIFEGITLTQTCPLVKEIWVSQGIYYTSSGTDRTISLNLPDSLRLIGGFSGYEDSKAERDLVNHRTILSGDIGIQGEQSDNSYNVIYIENSKNVLIDGFTIQDGNSNGTLLLNQNGSGIYNAGEVTLKSMTFKENLGLNGSSIIHNVSSNASLTLDSVEIVISNGSTLLPIVNKDTSNLIIKNKLTLKKE